MSLFSPFSSKKVDKSYIWQYSPNMVSDGKSKSLILSAFVRLMGGIIRLALRNGVTCTELTDIAKLLYVKIATEEYGLRGRETNASRVGMMTGIDRKEVKKIKERIDNIDDFDAEPDKLGSILSHWHTQAPYCDERGPKAIPFDGKGPSFSALVKQHAAGMAAVSILREFKRSKVVMENEYGSLTVLKQAYMPNHYSQNSDKVPDFICPKAIGLGSSMLTDHLNTIFHNLYRDDTGASERFDRRATNVDVKLSKLDEFHALLGKLGMDFLIAMDNWLSANQVKDSRAFPAEPTVRLGVGVYAIQGVDTSV